MTQLPLRCFDDIRVNGIGQQEDRKRLQVFNWVSVQVRKQPGASRRSPRSGYRREAMQRLARLAIPFAMLVALAIVIGALAGDSRAELENQVFTSRSDRLRLIVPRNWRATDHPTYPGLLLWMMRTQPPGQIVLSSEAFTRELYCSWPVACRAAIDTPTNKYACALR